KSNCTVICKLLTASTCHGYCIQNVEKKYIFINSYCFLKIQYWGIKGKLLGKHYLPL
ncbi:hypothetical protein L9F63_004386, partial [Diploptera punctata]